MTVEKETDGIKGSGLVNTERGEVVQTHPLSSPSRAGIVLSELLRHPYQDGCDGERTRRRSSFSSLRFLILRVAVGCCWLCGWLDMCGGVAMILGRGVFGMSEEVRGGKRW
jgi:hypothetical protein